MNINSLKENYFDSNPNNLLFLKNLVEDSHSGIRLDNAFSIFKSINEILYLIYSNSNKSIILYNLLNNQKISEIKNAHKDFILSFRHYLVRINNIDLIMSISCEDNNIRLWKISSLECILNLTNINNFGRLEAACFLYCENKNYIMTSNCNYENISEPIKIYDFKGNKIKEINNSKEITKFIDIYYDIKLNEAYIITGNKGFSKSYDLKANKIYNYYEDKEKYLEFNISLIISNINDKICLIESSIGGLIRIWNFQSAILINKIDIKKNYGEQILYGLCLWNDKYLFVGNNKRTIILLELKNYKVLKQFQSDNGSILTIKKIFHSKYGECLISLGTKGAIQLWVIKK